MNKRGCITFHGEAQPSGRPQWAYLYPPGWLRDVADENEFIGDALSYQQTLLV